MNYLVFGAGLSGQKAAILLAKKNLRVTITNDRPLSEQLTAELNAHGINIHVGEQTASILKDIDEVVLSPGISHEHPLIVAAKEKNIPLVSEVDLALRYFNGRLVGVTGTNGKSTTTAMIAHILNRIGIKSVACGNIGKACSDVAAGEDAYDCWVIELSSYQLESSHNIRTDACVMTSFSFDHIARHKTMDAYFDAKWKLIVDRKNNAPVILSESAYQAAKNFSKNFAGINHQVIKDCIGFDFSCTPLLTKHDKINAIMAATAVSYLTEGYTLQQLINQLNSFKTLAFRYEFVGMNNGARVINDSKATNVESVEKALDSQTTPCLLLLGGQGKGESFTPILRYENVIQEVYCFGQSRKEIMRDLSSRLVVKEFETLHACLGHIIENLARIKVPIIFSPGCASFDEFKNFEDRGHFFTATMRQHL